MQDLENSGLVRVAEKVSTAGLNVPANNHAKWFILLGQFRARNFTHLLQVRARLKRELAEYQADTDADPNRKPPSFASAESEANKIARRWYLLPGTGLEKFDHLTRALSLPEDVSAWLRKRRRETGQHLKKFDQLAEVPFDPEHVIAAIESTRDVVHARRLIADWLDEVARIYSAPPTWAPNAPPDIKRVGAGLLNSTDKLTIVIGPAGAGKTRWLQAQTANAATLSVQNGRERRGPRIPLYVHAADLTSPAAASEPFEELQLRTIRAAITHTRSSFAIDDCEAIEHELHRLSNSGDANFLVIIDGVDEIPDDALRMLTMAGNSPLDSWLSHPQASVVMGVRDGPAASTLIRRERPKPGVVAVSLLDEHEFGQMARNWGADLNQQQLVAMRSRFPTALLATFAFSYGRPDARTADLYELAIRGMLSHRWKDALVAHEMSTDHLIDIAGAIAHHAATYDDNRWLTSDTAPRMRRIARAAGASHDELSALAAVVPGLDTNSDHIGWAHATVQDFLVAWHMTHSLSSKTAMDYLRQRWWHRTEWRRVAVHFASLSEDPTPLLEALDNDARNDPFGQLDVLALHCASEAEDKVATPETVQRMIAMVAAPNLPIDPHLQSVAEALALYGGADAFARIDPRAYLDEDGESPSRALLAGVSVGDRSALSALTGMLARFTSSELWYEPGSEWKDPEDPDPPPTWSETIEAALPHLGLDELTAGLQSPFTLLPRLLFRQEMIRRSLVAEIPHHPRLGDVRAFIEGGTPEQARRAFLEFLECGMRYWRISGEIHPALHTEERADEREYWDPLEHAAAKADVLARALPQQFLLQVAQSPDIEHWTRVRLINAATRLGSTAFAGLASDETLLMEGLHESVRLLGSRSGFDRNRGAINALDTVLLAGLSSSQYSSATRAALLETVAGCGELRVSVRIEAIRLLDEIDSGHACRLGVQVLRQTTKCPDWSYFTLFSILKRQDLGAAVEAISRVGLSHDYYETGLELLLIRNAVQEQSDQDKRTLYDEANYVVRNAAAAFLHEFASVAELAGKVRQSERPSVTDPALQALAHIDGGIAALFLDEALPDHFPKCLDPMACGDLTDALEAAAPPGLRRQTTIHRQGLRMIAQGDFTPVSSYEELIKARKQAGRTPDEMCGRLAAALSNAARTSRVGFAMLEERMLEHPEFEYRLFQADADLARSLLERALVTGDAEWTTDRTARLAHFGSALAMDHQIASIRAEDQLLINVWNPHSDWAMMSGEYIEEYEHIQSSSCRDAMLRLTNAYSLEATPQLARALRETVMTYAGHLTLDDSGQVRRALAQHSSGLRRMLTT